MRDRQPEENIHGEVIPMDQHKEGEREEKRIPEKIPCGRACGTRNSEKRLMNCE